MSKRLTLIGLVLVLAAFVSSCSKSSSTSSGGTAPTLTAPTFAGPDTSAATDTSEAAYTAIIAAETFNVISSGYVGLLTGHTGTQNGNTWTWNYTYPQTTATITWTATSSSSGYSWKLVENGTLSTVTYNNWTALTGYESTDGKTGNWIIYFDNSTNVQDSVGWSTAASGNLNGTILEYNTTGQVSSVLVFTENLTSHTGELVIYGGPISAATKVWDISWTASGGTWTEYYGGTTVNTGHW